MGADFIILRHDLDDDPHVIRCAQLLGQPEGLVIDAFRKLWRYVSLHTEEGFLPGAGPRLIDSIAGLEGFSRAASEVGWLTLQIPGVQVPNFDEYLSIEALQKACAAFLKEHPLPKKLRTNWPGFEDFYLAYPRKKAKRDAQRAWDVLAPDESLQAAIREKLALALEEWTRSKTLAKHIPYPATWLRGQRWRDEEDTHGPGQDVGAAARVRPEPGKYARLSRAIVAETAAPPAPGESGLLFPEKGP